MSSAQISDRSGFALVLVTAVSVIVVSLIASSLYQVNRQIQIAQAHKREIQALVLAESGLAKGKSLIKNNAAFYTDSNYSGTTENLKPWIIQDSVGYYEKLNKGNIKIIKEQSRNRLFSIGYFGDTVQDAIARKILQLDFQIENGLVINSRWHEL